MCTLISALCDLGCSIYILIYQSVHTLMAYTINLLTNTGGNNLNETHQVTVDIETLQKHLEDLENRVKNERLLRLATEESLMDQLNYLRSNSKEYWLRMVNANRRCCLKSKLYHQVATGDLKRWASEHVTALNSSVKHLLREIESLSAQLGYYENQGPPESLTISKIKSIISTAISVYDADKTAKPDFALYTSGGRVVSIRCTKVYKPDSWTLQKYTSEDPNMAINPSVFAGQCWAFEGAVGFLVIRLSMKIFVDGLTLEHLPQRLHPLGAVRSAPKDLRVWGLKEVNDPHPHLFGSYVYDPSAGSLQYFEVENKILRSFQFVELVVDSNHGHPNYTCIYRIRVHGSPQV